MINGINEKSEKEANELQQEAWERARNGGIPKIEIPDIGSLKPEPFNLLDKLLEKYRGKKTDEGETK